jgi:hypothetical protein
MRILQIGAVGAALSYLALSFSQSGTGYPQAAAFLLAIFAATMTVGIALAVACGAWPDDAGAAGLPRNLPAHSCHGCGRPMVDVHSAWVCGRCDRAPVS